MARSKTKSLPQFDYLDDLVEFFDSNDMGDYWDRMPEMHFDINVKKRRHLVTIDEELLVKLAEIAKSKNVSSEKLINSWLREKVFGRN
ncbi:MAG TPA: CopG family antitoxin [bacterium]